MTDKRLTVSIAAYNVDRYLRKCLDSLAVPEIMDSLEVFIVDDGSTDGTSAIADEYAANYPGTFIAVHQKNGGYGTTVNYSMEHANGKYFKILDGDDWFDKNGLIRLTEQLKDTDVDVLLNNSEFIYQDEDSFRLFYSFKKESVKNVEIADFNPEILWNAHHVTYKTEILKRSNIHLPGNTLYTDNLYFTIPFAYLKTVRYLDWPVYCYRMSREGQSTARVSLAKHADDLVDMMRRLCRFYEKQKEQGCVSLRCLCHRISVSYHWVVKALVYRGITKSTLEQIKAREKELQELSPDIYAASAKYGKVGFLLRIMRGTHYAAFYLIRFLPAKFR